ncbi:prostaglandin reductase-3 isoform X2 [Jatropha curcas]|uniref:prostaglandin reductase-3 isoform X2 n=1 Tax=Jatropha curcas TaxID=180498 RepID=UPI0018942B0C|nr:prostaglandin reductase-3 isoform X2 [Jatropha curcas]
MQFVETEMGAKVNAKLVDRMGGFVPMQMVIKGAFELISDESKASSCLWITNRRGMEYWPTPEEEKKYLVGSSPSKKRLLFQGPVKLQLPQSFEKIVVHTLDHNFRKATRVVCTPLQLPIGPHQVLVKIIYAGVNASDVNFSSGRYFTGNKNDISSRLPFDAGFEAVGIIAALGESVRDLKIGTPAAIMTFGSYAEFTVLAKLAGNKVVATCGGKEKAMLLKELGVDRVIDYKAENIKTVLKEEFPKGVDIIYESVGGDMFDLCLNALAVHGRLIVIGMISQYQGEHGWRPSNYTGLCEKILAKSQTVAGFFLVQYGHLWQQHLDRLFNLFSTGKLKVSVDPKRFNGVRAVADAVEYLHSGKSVGKVVVCIDPTFSEQTAKL